MDRKFIKVLIEEGKPVSEMKQPEALVKLNNEVMAVYVLNGLHRGMQPDAFKEEVRTCAVALYRELSEDPSYKTIRDKEISYIFSNGMKGRLGTDKDIILSYKNLLRWIEGYVKHPERKEAMSMYVDGKRETPPQLAPHVLDDEDYSRMVHDAWNDFKQFKEMQRARMSRPEKKADEAGPRSIGEIIGGVPLSCSDYGRKRIEYLRRIGRATDNESLLDVFERAYSNGGEF